jgi:hypothetical protein
VRLIYSTPLIVHPAQSGWFGQVFSLVLLSVVRVWRSGFRVDQSRDASTVNDHHPSEEAGKLEKRAVFASGIMLTR